MAELEAQEELDNTLVVLTSDHGSVAGLRFHGELVAERDYGYYNWYYGDPENDAVDYDRPQAALRPLVDTGNVGLTYSDSMLRVWLKDQSPAKVDEAAAAMETMAGVTAVWRRDGDHYDRVSKVRWHRMRSGGERSWFARKAQELVDTQAADYGPDLIATLPDDTTYSVAGDHGGIQRAAQQIPIVFAGAGPVRPGPPRGGPLRRHHAHRAQGDGHPAHLPDGRRRLRAALSLEAGALKRGH